MLRDVPGVPGESGEPSGEAAWFHGEKTEPYINGSIVCSHNEASFACLAQLSM